MKLTTSYKRIIKTVCNMVVTNMCIGFVNATFTMCTLKGWKEGGDHHMIHCISKNNHASIFPTWLLMCLLVLKHPSSE